MKYKIIDKATNKELDYSKYALTAYGDVLCLTNGLVLLNKDDFIIEIVDADFNKITQNQLETISHLFKTISGHKLQCFLKEVIEKTNPNDYKEFGGHKKIKNKLKDIEILVKMFDKIDFIEQEQSKRIQSILNKP